MCGILFVYRLLQDKPEQQKVLVQSLSKLLTHRGPDESDIHSFTAKGENDKLYSVYLSHERLSIIDLTTGKQPLFNEDKSIAVIHNGEIYNHSKLHSEKLSSHTFSSHSDSESIVHMYEEFGPVATPGQLDGYFAFVLYDSKTDTVYAGRDPIGIKPMFIGTASDGSVWFSSEVKALVKVPNMEKVQYFPPGFFYLHKNAHTTPVSEAQMTRYYNPKWFDAKVYNKEKTDLKLIKQTLEQAVEKRLMSDVPLGVLLSGGLDSSLIAAITRKKLLERGVKELHSFSVGVVDEKGENASPDIEAARKVAKHIGTTHHEKFFTVQEGIQALQSVIYHIESYDVTTIRASTPMFLLSGLVQQFVKVVMSGEGADEVFAGYKYFRDAKDGDHLQDELVRKVQNLHLADVLRCDRSTAAHSLEARVPFLDLDFLDLAMSINPEQKLFKYQHEPQETRILEKFIVRAAFDGTNILPEDMLWRPKEQFSDGVGFSWIDTLISHCESQVTEQDMETAAVRFPHNTPSTKEGFYYRTIFEKMFPAKIGCDKLINKWLPWSKFDVDPSGRFQRSYAEEEKQQ